MKTNKTLWPIIAFVVFVGFVLFGGWFLFLLIALLIFTVSQPGLGNQILAGINNGSWEDLFNSLQNIGKAPPKSSKSRSRPSSSTAAKFTFTPSTTFDPMKTFGKIIAPLMVIGAIVLIILDGITTVPAGHVGIIFDRGRGVLEQELDEGIHLKIPFWQSVILMNTRLQTYTMSTHLSEADMINNTKAMQIQSLARSSESAIRNYALSSGETNNSIDALTKDGQRVTVDLTVQFQIDGGNASEIYQTIGLGYVDKVVRPAARSITREKVTGFTSKELYNESTRAKMEEEIESSMQSNFAAKNIVLGDVLIRHIGFSQSYLNAIEEKQIAQQKIEKAEFEKQEAEIRKEKTIIEAEAEAESIKLKGDALATSPEVIQLQFVEKMAPQIKWGIMPEGGLPLLDIKQLTQ